MATFAVTVQRLTIAPHPNADRLELAQIGGYVSVVGKGQFATGDLAAYIPEAALVPDDVLAQMGLEGKLAGAEGRRVKAMRLRGVLSQGLCYPARGEWELGQDVTEELGVVKYEPPVPTHMSGVLWGAGPERTLRYDVENIKRFPDVFQEAEEVVFAEKLHGTWCQIGLMDESLADEAHGDLVVSSKGQAAKGLAFVPDAQENAHNLYLRAARATGLEQSVDEAQRPCFVLGEVFGAGVQDLGYGHHAKQEQGLGFRVFDVYVGRPGQGRYLDDAELDAWCAQHDVERVPVLYRGPFSQEALEHWTSGKESVSKQALHIREGVIVRPARERRDDALGRVQLKSIAPEYLLRKNATEYT